MFKIAGGEIRIESVHGLPVLRLSKEGLKIAIVCAAHQEEFLYAWAATGDAPNLSQIIQIIISLLGENGGDTTAE